MLIYHCRSLGASPDGDILTERCGWNILRSEQNDEHFANGIDRNTSPRIKLFEFVFSFL